MKEGRTTQERLGLAWHAAIMTARGRRGEDFKGFQSLFEMS